MREYPQDSEQKKKERRSFNLMIPLFDPDCWDFIGSDKNDHGVDYTYELIEEGKFKGYRVLIQVKSRTDPEIRDDKIIFDFPVKTANYAVGSAQPFFFILINLSTRNGYYICLQDYFIENKDAIKKLDRNTSSIRVFVPLANHVDDDNFRKIAHRQYSYSETDGLRKVR